MTKRLVDIDDHALDAARAGLGTHTIKDTVNEALRRAAENRRAAVKKSLDVLARADLVDREEAWR
jgi:Arc/MetJ family transcription regulator